MVEPTFRDFLYLDFDKAASIWSQLQGGLRQTIAATEESGGGQHAGVTLGIPKIAEAKLGADYSTKRSVLDTKVLHHDILNLVDAELSQLDLVVDLMKAVPPHETEPDAIQNAIGTFPYVKATGPSVIEDYRRILAISEKFNEVLKLVATSQVEAAKTSPQYQQLEAMLNDAKLEVKAIKDRNQRAVKQQMLHSLEGQLQQVLTAGVQAIDESAIKGIRLMIETFMPTRINFRIFPFSNCPRFQVICNLKRECFVDQDLDHLLYGYGNRPNVPLTVFGLLTSIPPKDETELLDPLAEFSDEEAGAPEHVAFEKAFRGLFNGMEKLETAVRFSRYPSITIHPIAIYRSFEITHA